MSASRKPRPWWSMILRPNVVALVGVGDAPRRAPPAPSPIATAAMPSRPESSALNAICRPWPSSTDEPVGVEEGVVVERRRGRDRVQPHLLLGLAERQPRQAGGAPGSRRRRGCLLRCGRTACRSRPAAVGDPRLRAVDDVAAVACAWPHTAAPPRRTRPAAPTGCTRRSARRTSMPRQPALLLFVDAERQQRMTRQAVHADRHRDRGPAGGDLLEYLQVHLERLPAATPLLRLRKTQQTGGAELGEHPFGI